MVGVRGKGFIQDNHPEMAIMLSYSPPFQISIRSVNVQRPVLLFDGNIMKLDNGG